MVTRANVPVIERGFTPQAQQNATQPKPDKTGFDQRKAEEQWEEREAPQQLKFEQKGDTFVGILRAVQTILVQGKEVIKYLFEDGGKQFECLATFDLARKIMSADRGRIVRIELIGFDESMGRDGNAMRVFSVKFKKGSAQQTNEWSPTDSDIPF